MTSFNFCQSNFFFFLLSMRKRERLWGSQAAMFPTEHRPRSALTGYKPRPRCGAQTGPSTSTSQTRQRQSPSEATEPLSPSPLSNANDRYFPTASGTKRMRYPTSEPPLTPTTPGEAAAPIPPWDRPEQPQILKATLSARPRSCGSSGLRSLSRGQPHEPSFRRRSWSWWPRTTARALATRRESPRRTAPTAAYRAWSGRPVHVPAIRSVSPARAP